MSGGITKTQLIAFEVDLIYPNGLWLQPWYSKRMPAIRKTDKQLRWLIPATAVVYGDFFQSDPF
jgi:hypothetical protein